VTDLQALINRVAKNQRHLAKWARREGLEAYRLYDRDIPEFPFAIDRYGSWLHVQQFDRRRELPSELLDDLPVRLAERFGLPASQVILKQRQRQRGTLQYEKTGRTAPSFTVRERGLRFEVNLGRYLDTGLFPDHRETRRWVGEHTAGKTLLNLFAYTGSFTVYAAAGNARRTVTVDMSRTYQDWSRRNLVHNRLDDRTRHHFVQADVLTFIERMAAEKARFDLVVLDPPSFSNSKRMQATFDVQRDHPDLLRKTLRLLAPGGTLVFSNNRQGFRLDPVIASLANVEEATHWTVPADFSRHQPHRCWLLSV
jgi:23S rRNA (cytosine1962-C5)-methyltransferase